MASKRPSRSVAATTSLTPIRDKTSAKGSSSSAADISSSAPQGKASTKMSTCSSAEVPSTSTTPHRPYDCSTDDSSEDEFVPRRVDNWLENDDVTSCESDFELDENSGDPGQRGLVWHKKENVPKVHPFTASPGLHVDLDKDSKPFEIYLQFVTYELIDLLVKETNRYYHQQKAASPSSASMEWVDTSREEMQRYLGLQLLSSMHDLDCEMYWSHMLLYKPVYPETMSLGRFLQLSRNLHVADNEAEHPVDDRLWKLRPAIDLLNRQFKMVCTPTRRLTIDESFWDFCSGDSDNDTKNYFRVKVYKLCVGDGRGTGYTCAFQIHAGLHNGDIPAPTQTVVDLMADADLLGKGYELYTDVLYTSPRLFHYLMSRKTNAVGEVYQYRKMLPEGLETDRFGSADFRSTDTGLLCLQWRSRTEDYITMLSTVHNSGMDEHSTRDKKFKPKVVTDHRAGYQKHDLSWSYKNGAFRYTAKWHQRVLFYMLDLAVKNAFFVYRVLGGKLDEYCFKVKVVRGLIPSASKGRRGRRK